MPSTAACATGWSEAASAAPRTAGLKAAEEFGEELSQVVEVGVKQGDGEKGEKC